MNGRDRLVVRAAGLILGGFVSFVGVPCPLLGQGSLTTPDGLRLMLGGTGTVSSLQSGGLEYAASGIPSGFMYRELPTTVPNIAPNGSFETGSTSPTSWSWANDSTGSWTLDSAVKAVGNRSMKLAVPGTVAKVGPAMKSGTFALLPNTSYTLTCRFKTSGVGAAGLTLFLVEQHSDGTIAQPHFASDLGTVDWTTKTVSFTTAANAVTGYLKAQMYSGYGTVWLDDVQVSDVFGGRKPVSFGGSVSSDAGGLTQTANTNGLSLSARYTSVGSAIKVDATLTDTTGQDRMVEVSYRLPVDVAGWTWGEDFVTPAVIQDGVRYENVDISVGKQGRSLYPFATVSGAASFSLAVPMGPQMQRFGYDTVNGLRSTWDLGLSAAATKTKSKASWTLWIYTSAPQWGMRAAAEKYYALEAASFTTSVNMGGAWVLASEPSLIPNWKDFGWGLQEGTSDVPFDNQNGILSYAYLFANGWFYDFPDGAQAPYNTLISTLNSEAASGTGMTVNSTPVKEMAQAIVNSSPYNSQGLYWVQDNYFFWYKNYLQIYPALPDPDIPAPSLWSVLKKYGVDNRISMWQGAGNHLDGIFLDTLSYIFASGENHRRSLWAYSDFPLSFSYVSRKVVQYDGNAMAEFCRSMRTYLNGKGMGLMGNNNAPDMMWVAPWLDVVGGETNGVLSKDNAYEKRALSYGKNLSNLYVPSTGVTPTAADVLKYLRQALLLGYFPGFNDSYWLNPTLYERDRAIFKQYTPLIKKAVQAGWRPVNYGTPSDAAIYVERFDDQIGNTFYLTAQNSGTTTKTFQMTVDAASLGASTGAITAKELVGNTTVSASRSGSNILFSDTLAAGETALYEITVGTGSPPPPPPPPPPSGVPANNSLETGSVSPTSWTLGTSVTNGNWTWDATTASQGTRSAKLMVTGTANKKSPALRSATFALAAGRTFTLSAGLRSSGIGGNNPPTVWVVQLDAAGNVLKTASGATLQFAVRADTGTVAWARKTVTFSTDARCAQAYVYANIYDGYGTVWVDDVQVN